MPVTEGAENPTQWYVGELHTSRTVLYNCLHSLGLCDELQQRLRVSEQTREANERKFIKEVLLFACYLFIVC